MRDDLIQNSRRLTVAHACLALISAFVYWIRPGTFTPYLPIYNFRDSSPIFVTFIAWVPYVISFFFSRATLAEVGPKAVFGFIVLATGISLASAGVLFRVLPIEPSPIVVFGGVTITLIIIAKLCSMIWSRCYVPR